MSILVTGGGTGLGRYLAERFNAEIATRERPVPAPGTVAEPYDAIVHCAFNMRRDVTPALIEAYLADTIGLTDAVVRLPHRAFVLLSSIDVYPHGAALFDEDTALDAFAPRNLYALCKMAAEATVARLATNPLILRAGALLGPYMRPNNITRLLRGDVAPLTLTADSSFHCVGYGDIAAIVEHALATGLIGTFNAALCPAVTLGEVAARFGRTPVFGAFRYQAPHVSNDRLCGVIAGLRRSSLSAVEAFAASLEARG